MGIAELEVKGIFIDMGALILIPRGGFWSTIAIEDRGMLGRIESGCEPPYPGGLVSEGESRE